MNMKGTVFQPRMLQLNLDNINRLPHSKYPDRKNRGMCRRGTRWPNGSRWPNGLGICLARRRSWIRVPRRHILQFFLSGYLLCGSRFMLSKFNCNILGWKTVPLIFMRRFDPEVNYSLLRSLFCTLTCGHASSDVCYMKLVYGFSQSKTSIYAIAYRLFV